jgi:hypothetical protein
MEKTAAGRLGKRLIVFQPRLLLLLAVFNLSPP